MLDVRCWMLVGGRRVLGFNQHPTSNIQHPPGGHMAVKIEKGGWVLIFAIGLGLVGYSLNRYGVVDFGGMFDARPARKPAAAIDPSKPLVLPPSGTPETKDVRLRVNIWVGCVGGLVANGGLDTATESIYGNKGLKVSFKIIDDWTEGSAALATNNVDIMLT